MIRLSNIKISLKKINDNRDELDLIRQAVLKKLGINEKELIGYEIFKRSIDARKKDDLYYVYTIDVKTHNEQRILRNHNRKGVIKTPDMAYEGVKFGEDKMSYRPVIIGMGPAGLFAGLTLSKLGYRPIILERGEDVDARTDKIGNFWREGILDPDSNVQFGEGGAGTFSDGKLTTLINDKRCRLVLNEFVKAGAPEEILYINKPHIGTDILKSVIKTIRQRIIENGGEVRFNAKVTDFIIEDDKLEGVIINDCEKLACNTALLGIGHSARDTFQILYKRGVHITQKPFSIGVRIEHPQHFIDMAQYCSFARHPCLWAADYKLSYHSKNGRSAYTFCMCPGGYVIAAASEDGGVVTNGMSKYARDGENANSALLVGVTPNDFGSSHPLAGVEFQRRWERAAYKISGENYSAPVQLIGDFLKDRPSTQFGSVEPTYKPGVKFVELKYCLPDYVIATMKEAIVYFDAKIKGFNMSDGILTGVETRSSSPIRINRDDEYLSNISGLYPIGEGAGYAGGIMSSAVDGIRVAENIVSKYASFV